MSGDWFSAWWSWWRSLNGWGVESKTALLPSAVVKRKTINVSLAKLKPRPGRVHIVIEWDDGGGFSFTLGGSAVDLKTWVAILENMSDPADTILQNIK
jgi:hypothetical protein